MSATSGGGSVSEGSDAGESSQSTMSATDSPSTSFQAKRADNVTKISLDEPDHHADLTGSKINLTSEERQQKDGVVNMAFDYEEGGNRMVVGGGGGGAATAAAGGAVSVGVGGAAINGTEKKEMVPEAVNLELVNMVPYSNGNGTSYGVPVNGIPGIPAKKDSEQVDMSSAYDEYFVPVNEHKKYMRGEKLYVTKDKRRPTSWRRCLSWIVACTVISVVLIVAILAGTGVILSQDQNLVKEASIGRNFAGANLKPSVTQKSSITPMPTGTKDWSSPTTDMSYMYVPRSIESELIIDNVDFDPALLDANSSAYQQFSSMMEDQLKMILFDKETLEFGASELGLRVVNISREPFKVNYRIGWNYKQGVSNPPEPIKMEDVKRRLVESLARNEGYIDKYHVDMEGIKVDHVINVCQMNNGGCSHICYYNYLTQLFTCTCPTHLVLDESRKNCVEWMGSSEQDVLSVPTHFGHETTGEAKEEEYVSHHEHDLHREGGMREHEPAAEPAPEPTAEPAPEPNVENDERYKEHEPSAEPAPEPIGDHDHLKVEKHEPSAEPTPEPAGDHDRHAVKEHEPSAEPTPEPTVNREDLNVRGFELSAEPTPEPTGDHDHLIVKEHEPSAKPAPEPTSDSDHLNAKEHEPSAEPTPEPRADQDHLGVKEHEPSAEPTPEPTADHDHQDRKEHEPSAEPTPEPTGDLDHLIVKEHEPSAEPTPEPTADHDHQDRKEHEPSAEPTPEPTADHDHQDRKEHEPSAEPAPEPTGDLDHLIVKEHEPSAEPTPEPTSDHDHLNAKDHEPSAEPTPEPTSDHDHQDRKEHEPSAEPTPEPVPDGDHLVVKEHEPSAEPTPEPTADQDHQVKKEHEPSAEPTPDQGVKEHGLVVEQMSEAAPEPTADRKEHEPAAEPTPSDASQDLSTAVKHEPAAEATPEHDLKEQMPTTTPDAASQNSQSNLESSQGVRQGNDTPQSGVYIHPVSETEAPAPEPTPQPIPGDEHDSNGHVGHGYDPTKTQEQERNSDLNKTQEQEHDNPAGTTIAPQVNAEQGTLPPHIQVLMNDTMVAPTAMPEDSLHTTEHHRVVLQDILVKHPEDAQDVLNSKPVVEEVIIDKATTLDEMQGHEGTTQRAVVIEVDPNATNVKNEAGEGVTTVPGVIEYKASDNTTPGGLNVPRAETQSTEKVVEEGNATESPVEGPKTTSQPERQQESFTVPVSIVSEDHGDSALKHDAGTTTERHVIAEVDATNLRDTKGEGKDKPEGGDGAVLKATGVETEAVGESTTKPPGQAAIEQANTTVEEKQNETTKTPEELSNNIKDEGLDNEEFNTLLENEEKDILNKYSGKPIKTEKKKLKDFVKNDKKINEATFKPPVTPEDFYLQKHVTGNTFDLDYGLHNEHTTKHDEELASIDQHHGVPGVSFIPDGISNHDVNVFQTVTPEFKSETGFSEETDTEGKKTEKEGEGKLEKDYPKFDKDYKYDKQKGGKKKELKKKAGGKDGKNVELDERKLFGDVTGKEFEDARSKETTDAMEEDVKGGVEARKDGSIIEGGAGVTENPKVDQTTVEGVAKTESSTSEHIQGGVTVMRTETDSPGTVYDGVPRGGTFVAPQDSNSTFVVYESTLPVGNATTAHPTIAIHGQSGSLQDGHIFKFGNVTVMPGGAIFNSTLGDGRTFPNGSAVHPTVVVTGQSGALLNGHETRFVTGAKGFAWNTTGTLGNSTVYRIENGSLPDTVFDGHFNPQDGQYHMFTNASGTFVYSNATRPSNFVISGHSGDFGNSSVYILSNGTTYKPSFGIQEVTSQGTPSNESFRFANISPSTFSSGTAYKVNNYFGYISKCAAGQFQCVNGTSKRGSACISLSSKCDSINDCSDGSDELGCIENGCPGNFQCSDGTCLKRHLVCNGIVDCSDGSDEQKCESWKCEFDEFQCPSGRCIPVVWQCDNKPDCDNHTDEYHCQTSCGNDEYLCPEGWCIPLTYKCNGVRECSNGEDEQLCDCSHDEFKCNTGGCVPQTQVCNGVDECPDRSDEWGCVKLEPDTNLLKVRTPSGDYEPICADNWQAQRSDEVCAFLGYYSSVPVENESNSSTTTETSFYVVKNDTTENFNKKLLVNLERSNGTCSSGKFVEISCQEFSCGFLSMTDSSSVEARLVGGMSATNGQWPSVALLYNMRNFHSCTANILTPRWVLASYNCLKMGNKNLNQQDWKFFGGSTVFEAEKEDAETRNIISIIPHPQVKFNQFLFSNDLALVELDQPMQFTSKVGAVCLPEEEMQPRQICVTAGWGMNLPEDKSIRQQLQYLPVPTMNLTECNSTNHYSGFITEDKICAGYSSPEKSLCYNEEGAPLMCVNERGEWELQGVLSYHRNCGRGSHPSIFSSIKPVKEWIKQTIGNSFERKVTPNTKR